MFGMLDYRTWKTLRAPLAALALLPLVSLMFTSCAAPPPSLTVEEIREEAEALVAVQSILSWYSNCVGEKSVISESYKGHERLFSPEAIKTVGTAASRSKNDDEKRALEFLRAYLITEHVALATAHFQDEIADAEANGMVAMVGMTGDVAYRDLDGLLDNEQDPEKRHAIQNLQSNFWRDVLNPIHERKTAEEHRIVDELGYPSYVALSEELRHVSLGDLTQMSGEFIEKTDEEYGVLFANQVQWILGIEVDEFRRSDIGRLSQVSSYNKFFPAELVIPAFEDFLEGIGLDMSTADGGEIFVNDDNHPKKDPRAVCYSMVPGSDVRVSVKPTGGIPDYETFFHEGGHAVHFASSTTDVWEYQQLGDNTVTEAYSGLYENLWGDPDWLRSYREYVRSYNRFVSTGEKVPLMTDEEIGRLVINRAFWDLYFVRRYAGAKMIYETILHGGDPSVYEGLYQNDSPDDMHETYRVLFSDAYGFDMTPSEALRFRTDVDPFFYSADYARSYALAKQMHEGLGKKFGKPWWRSREAGSYLKSELFSHANKFTGDEVAAKFGYESVNWEAFERILRERLDWAESILG